MPLMAICLRLLQDANLHKKNENRAVNAKFIIDRTLLRWVLKRNQSARFGPVALWKNENSPFFRLFRKFFINFAEFLLYR